MSHFHNIGYTGGQGCMEIKWKSQGAQQGGQSSNRMAHILLVEKTSVKGHFIATWDVCSSPTATSTTSPR